MKKIICVALALLLLLSCLTACDITQSMVDAIEEGAEATPKVEKMMAALADHNVADAKALLHPQLTEISDDAIIQMSDYLAGRTVSAMELENINTTSSAGVGGKIRQERLAYQVTLTDGAVIYLNVIHVSGSEGEGFTAFQIVLGVV